MCAGIFNLVRRCIYALNSGRRELLDDRFGENTTSAANVEPAQNSTTAQARSRNRALAVGSSAPSTGRKLLRKSICPYALCVGLEALVPQSSEARQFPARKQVRAQDQTKASFAPSGRGRPGQREHCRRRNTELPSPDEPWPKALPSRAANIQRSKLDSLPASPAGET